MKRSVGAPGAIALAAALAVCGGDQAVAGRPLGGQQRLNLGVVAVDARIGRAEARSSGTVIDAARGLVLTSAHSIWGATSLKLSTGLGILHGRIVARAPCDDLALIEIQPRLPGLVSLAGPARDDLRPAQLVSIGGRRVVAPNLGAYGLIRIPARSGRPDASLRLHRRLPALAAAVQLDAKLVPEVTGGPVLDRAGEVVGMAVASEGARSAAIPWPAIRLRLSELRPGPRRIYVGWRAQYRCVHALHAYARATYPGFRPLDARLTAPVPATRVPGTKDLDSR